MKHWLPSLKALAASIKAIIVWAISPRRQHQAQVLMQKREKCGAFDPAEDDAIADHKIPKVPRQVAV